MSSRVQPFSPSHRSAAPSSIGHRISQASKKGDSKAGQSSVGSASQELGAVPQKKDDSFASTSQGASKPGKSSLRKMISEALSSLSSLKAISEGSSGAEDKEERTPPLKDEKTPPKRTPPPPPPRPESRAGNRTPPPRTTESRAGHRPRTPPQNLQPGSSPAAISAQIQTVPVQSIQVQTIRVQPHQVQPEPAQLEQAQLVAINSPRPSKCSCSYIGGIFKAIATCCCNIKCPS